MNLFQTSIKQTWALFQLFRNQWNILKNGWIKKKRSKHLKTPLLIYRITDDYIEVHRNLHSHSSVSRIRKTRKIRL